MSKVVKNSLGGSSVKTKPVISTRQVISAVRVVFLYALAIGFGLIFLFPFYWMFISAVRAPGQVLAYPPKLIDFGLHLENIGRAWAAQNFFQYTINTLVIAVGASVGQLVAASLVAYGFARFDFPFKRVLFLLMLSGLIIPWDVVMIGQFVEFKALNWIDSPLPLIVPNCFGSPFIIFVAHQYMLTIPRDFDEAATIDGCNSFQVLYRIIMPLCRPILVFIFVFQFIYSWNDYLAPLIFITHKTNYTLMLGLTAFQGAYTNDWTSIMAVSSVIVAIPFVLFLAIQRYLVGGVSAEGVKG